MAEAGLYTTVKVARDEDLVEQIGRDTYFELVDHNKVHTFRVKRQTPFNLFKEEVATRFGIPVQFQRFWLWTKRQNNTYRPHRHVTPQQEARPVGRLRAVKAVDAELNLFLEVKHSIRGLPKIPSPVCSDDIFLFFKLYDPLKEELRYVGRFYVKADGMPVDILAKINRLAGFAPDGDIKLFEEICSEPNVWCEAVDKMITFRDNKLENGDIICFQISPEDESIGQCGYPNVCSFLEYVHHHQIKPEHHSKRGCYTSSEPKQTEKGRGTISDGSTAQAHSADDPAGKVNEVQEDVLRQATLSIEDFEQVGLELSWLKKRLEEAKKANKLAESLTFVDLCETALEVGRAKVRELEEALVKAKAELEDWSADLPKSLAVNDYLLMDVV